METLSTATEFQKSQAVRVIDMVFVAPVLVYAATTKNNLSEPLKIILFTIGIATFVYNANNYFKNRNLQSVNKTL